MKKILIITAATLSLSNFAFAEKDTHAHHGAKNGKSKLTLNNGKKWATDATLRKNMKIIKDVIKKNTDKIHSGKMTDKEYLAMAKVITAATDDTFKNCKLPTKADAQLHLILIDIINGKALIEKNKKEKIDGVVLIHKALGNYDTYFK